MRIYKYAHTVVMCYTCRLMINNPTMYIYAHGNACMYVCMCACMYVCPYDCMCVCMYLGMYVCH